MVISRISLFILAALLIFANSTSAMAAHMAMGFRVGEVTEDSAIVWTRITENAERNWNGVREEKKRTPRVEEYTPSPTDIADREGAAPGAAGQVRVLYSTDANLSDAESTDWADVDPEADFTHQFRLTGLKPATRYHLRVEARDGENAPTTAKQTGSFGTPAASDEWQDVTFTVVTGQSYWDLDDERGYHIYPAMGELKPDFIVPTGDTVYYDSESPRARTVDLARFHWHRMYSLPRHIEFHRSVPGYWEKDDHDTWVNDCWPSMTAKWMNPLTFQEGVELFKEQAPMGDSTYRTIRWGKGLQIWMVEGRDFRSPNDMPDGPEKTIWGTKQREWLLQTILDSDADFRVLISPTPIVGPDRRSKGDNHSNSAFAHAGNYFRNWTKENGLTNFFVCCGDRHWQYMSIDPKTNLHEFCSGPASDVHAGGTPGEEMDVHEFHRVKGGFLSVSVRREDDAPTIAFRHHDVHGRVVNEFEAENPRDE